MTVLQVEPGPVQAPYVHSFIYHTDYEPLQEKERVIPDGSPYLIFALDGHPRRVFDNTTLEPAATLTGAWLSGVQRDFITIEAVADSRMAAIRFRAGAAGAILGNAMQSSLGRIQPLQELDEIEVPALLDRLLATSDSDECMDEIREWIAARLTSGARSSAAVTEAVAAIEADPTFAEKGLADLVSASGYSWKQFVHHFKRDVGLTPKAFQRMMRFHEILPRVIRQENISWADISQQCGYYDQSHFIREFRRFSGYNPAEFLRGGTDRTNFLPITEG